MQLRWTPGTERDVTSIVQHRSKNTEAASGSEEGSFLRLIDFCITQL